MLKQLWSRLIDTKPQRTVQLMMPRKKSTSGLTEYEILMRESRIGAEVFGPIPAGHERTFVCLDERTWLWHEAWTNKDGVRQETTVRYKVQGDRVLKSYADSDRYLEGDELRNFMLAVRRYTELITRDIYQSEPEQAHA